MSPWMRCFFFFQAEDGIRDWSVTGVQTCALPIFNPQTANSPLRRDLNGVVTLQIGDVQWPRRDYIGEGDEVFRIHPVRPIEELRKTALLAARPRKPAALASPIS